MLDNNRFVEVMVFWVIDVLNRVFWDEFIRIIVNNVKCWFFKCCKFFVFYWDLNIIRILLLEIFKLMYYCYLLVVENMKFFVYWEFFLLFIFL